MKFVKFIIDHFPQYQSWFTDPLLNQQLGPMDEEWLEAVLNNSDGIDYAVFNQACLPAGRSEMIAVVGITFPVYDYPFYFINELAVKPQLRQTGIASKVLKQLFLLHPLKDNESWRAYISVDNPGARSFFEREAWELVRISGKDNDMYLMECRA